MPTPTSPLITPSDLADELSAERPPVLLDVRWQLGQPSQRPDYDAGHLPGARWVEFEEALSAAPGEGGRHPMPSAEAFQGAMRAAGVNDADQVVVYDRANSLAASRLWWLLRYFGHADVRVLDGGLDGWVASGRETTTEIPDPRPGDFTARPAHEGLLSADDVADRTEGTVLLDARPADRFRGENETVDPVAGHIPGARSVPALTNVDEQGRFLPVDQLAARFSAAGVEPGGDVAVYCGSGVQAAHLALALEHSELRPRTGVYVGSWSHWITDPNRPVERG